MLGENAVRFRVAPISSAIAWNRLLKISRRTGFVFMGINAGFNPRPSHYLQHQVQIRIDPTPKLRRYESRRTVFADDCGTLYPVAMAQRLAIVDGGFNPLPVNPYGLRFQGLRLPALLRRFHKLRFWSAPEKRCTHIDQFNRAIGVR